MNERDFDEFSAGHALHALSAEDERAFQEALRARPDRQAHSRRDEDVAAELGAAVPEVAPPTDLRARLLDQIASIPQDPDAVAAVPVEDASESVIPDDLATPPAVSGPGMSRMGRIWFALAAGIALVVAIGAGVAVFANQLQQPTAAEVALQRIEDAGDAQSASSTLPDGGIATAHWSPSLGEAVLVSDGLPELPEDRAFELWYIREGTPISAGVFTTDDRDATARLEGDMHAGDVIAVTIEQAGGSPTGDPTTDAILAIPTES